MAESVGDCFDQVSTCYLAFVPVSRGKNYLLGPRGPSSQAAPTPLSKNVGLSLLLGAWGASER